MTLDPFKNKPVSWLGFPGAQPMMFLQHVLAYGCILPYAFYLPIKVRPLQDVPFCPISVSGENFNPQNTQCIPAVEIFAFLELEQN